MQIDQLAFVATLILFPGILCTLLVERLTSHKRGDALTVGLRALLYGVAAYCLLYCWRAWRTANWSPRMELLGLLAKSGNDTPPLREILAATAIAVPLAVVVAVEVNNQLINRFARLVRITAKFAESDVWEHAFNDQKTSWVSIRMPADGIVYYGWLAAFSETEQKRSILLQDVEIRWIEPPDTDQSPQTLDRLYLEFHSDERIEIEFWDNGTVKEDDSEKERRTESKTKGGHATGGATTAAQTVGGEPAQEMSRFRSAVARARAYVAHLTGRCS